MRTTTAGTGTTSTVAICARHVFLCDDLLGSTKTHRRERGYCTNCGQRIIRSFKWTTREEEWIFPPLEEE